MLQSFKVYFLLERKVALHSILYDLRFLKWQGINICVLLHQIIYQNIIISSNIRLISFLHLKLFAELVYNNYINVTAAIRAPFNFNVHYLTMDSLYRIKMSSSLFLSDN